MTTTQILQALNSNQSLSAKGIASIAKVDADATELNRIQSTCWELCNKGLLIAIDCRDQKNGGLFFRATPKP